MHDAAIQLLINHKIKPRRQMKLKKKNYKTHGKGVPDADTQ
jgi:hypothetical protein